MIKNDRQFQLATAQVRKLRGALDDLRVHPGSATEPAHLIQFKRDAISGELSGMLSEIEEYAALKSGVVTATSVRKLEDLPAALIRQRISGGMTQKQLADRLGIAEQQVQRYEANDYASASLERLQEVANAVELELIPEFEMTRVPRLRDILTKLSKTGFDRGFVLRRIASSSALAQHANDYARPAIDLMARIGRMFALSPESLLGPEPLRFPPRSVVATYKLPKSASTQKVQALTAYARFYSSLVLAGSELQPKSMPTDAILFRDDVERERLGFNFEAIVEYLWDHGVAVLPLAESGGFDAAVFREPDGRAAIVLKQAARNSARWTFDLLHEVGHLVRSNYVELSIVDGDPESSSDEQEIQANSFASDALLRGRGDELFTAVKKRANFYGPALKRATLDIAKEYNLSPASLALDVAFRLKREQDFSWWGVAQNISSASGEDPIGIAIDALARHVDLDRLGQLDRELLMQATSE